MKFCLIFSLYPHPLTLVYSYNYTRGIPACHFIYSNKLTVCYSLFVIAVMVLIYSILT